MVSRCFEWQCVFQRQIYCVWSYLVWETSLPFSWGRGIKGTIMPFISIVCVREMFAFVSVCVDFVSWINPSTFCSSVSCLLRSQTQVHTCAAHFPLFMDKSSTWWLAASPALQLVHALQFPFGRGQLSRSLFSSQNYALILRKLLICLKPFRNIFFKHAI